jgi:site-specific recombinase XerC
LLGHLATGRRRASGGHLVKQPRSLPESLEEAGVSAFLADLNTHRDRAMTLAMVLGGLRLAKVRALLLADVDIGARRVRVVGKGNRERVVPTGAWRELPTSEPPQAPDVRELFVR